MPSTRRAAQGSGAEAPAYLTRRLRTGPPANPQKTLVHGVECRGRGHRPGLTVARGETVSGCSLQSVSWPAWRRQADRTRRTRAIGVRNSAPASVRGPTRNAPDRRSGASLAGRSRRRGSAAGGRLLRAAPQSVFGRRGMPSESCAAQTYFMSTNLRQSRPAGTSPVSARSAMNRSIAAALSKPPSGLIWSSSTL